MKLHEALQLLAVARARPSVKRVALACGFEPLHLATFLQACFAARFAEQRLELASGLYGDLEGNVARAVDGGADAAAVVLEWADLDPRLGLRASAPWSGASAAQIVRDVEQRLERIAAALEHASTRVPVVVCAATIPLLHAGATASSQHSRFELALQHAQAAFLLRVAGLARVRVVHPGALDARSPPGERHDPRMALAAGFPYALPHASALAEQLIALLFPASAKKALISDLDDTLWAGLAGEVGPGAVSWSLADGAQLHGLYQLVLRQLADRGALLGAASKNDPEVARAALARADLWLDGASFFPVAASWGPKSESVRAIVRSWNLDPADVVFVDDDAMELAEVQRVFPQLQCLHFPKDDPGKALSLFVRLRELFGGDVVTRDDALRAASVRAGAEFAEQKSVHADQAAFIRSLQGSLTFRRDREVDLQRALQLLNKTNQFNLNGRRAGERELADLLEREHGFVLECEYSDRFGPLGTIACVAGRSDEGQVIVQHWALSCRAFSRRIEQRIARELLRLAAGRELLLDYARTAKNAPLRLFLQQLGVLPDAQQALVAVPADHAELTDSAPDREASSHG